MLSMVKYLLRCLQTFYMQHVYMSLPAAAKRKAPVFKGELNGNIKW